MLTDFSRCLLEWYSQSARVLPWRGRSDPYAVWVSEVMLQQTRVETVIPYYERWMERFPVLSKLAAASEQDVLRLWEGLGYYSRARNLYRAAKIVMDEYNGMLPTRREELERLPGIGRYTAAAVASIAFGRDEAALDGNIRRVLARVFDVTEPARSPRSEAILWQLARENLPAGRAGDYNQAMMDLGAQVCTPRSPACRECPLEVLCRACLLGVQEERPAVIKKAPVPHYTVTAAVIRRDGRVLVACRPPDGLLGGLWEFPGGKQEAGEDLITCLKREIMEELGVEVQVKEAIGIFRHAYSHFRVTLHAFECTLLMDGEPRPFQASEICWVLPDELRRYPMGKIDRQISRILVKIAAG